MITEKKTQFLLDELEQLRQQGLFRPLRVLGSAQDTEVLVDGKHVLNLSSNNYLGLTTHPRLKEAMIQATQQWGAGSGAVRTIAGTMTVHEDLERRLAEFKHTEASLVFQSGFTANLGVLQSLVREGDLLTSYELNHASIIHGVRQVDVVARGFARGPASGLGLPDPSSTAVVVQHLASRGDRGRLHRRDQRPSGRAGAPQAAVEEHRSLQGRSQTDRLRNRGQRD